MEFFFKFWIFDEPAVSNEKPWAADQSSVDRDILFERILSTLRTQS